MRIARITRHNLCAALAVAVLPVSMALVPTATKPEEVGMCSEWLHRIHDAVQRHLDAKELSGVVTVVSSRSRRDNRTISS